VRVGLESRSSARPAELGVKQPSLRYATALAETVKNRRRPRDRWSRLEGAAVFS